jgi:drug/metabolite transporter (DMT)-like permease
MTVHRLRAYFILTFVAIIWGLAGPVIKFTLGGIEPLTFLTYRFGISSVIALSFILTTKNHFPKDKKTILTMLVYGFLVSTLALGLLFLGLTKTTVLDMSLITAIGPLLIGLAGVIFLKEHVTSQEKLGMAIAFSGTLLTVMEPITSNSLNSGQLIGNLLIVLYLLVNTVGAILIKKLVRKKIPPLTLTNVSFIVGFLTLAPLALFSRGTGPLIQAISQLPLAYHLGILYMAIISGNLAYTLWVRGYKTIEVSEAALFSYLQPIFAAPLAIVWLQEKIRPPFIFGALLITIGVIIAEYKKRR